MLVFKYISKVLFFVVLFVFVFVLSFPKDKVYFAILKQLEDRNIQIESLDKDISIFGIELDKNNIYLSGANIAKVSQIDIGLFSLKMEQIKFQGSFAAMVPVVDSLDFGLGLGEFCVLRGKFGEVTMRLDIFDMKVVIDAQIDKTVYGQYRNIFGKFKQYEKGYRYEYSF